MIGIGLGIGQGAGGGSAAPFSFADIADLAWDLDPANYATGTWANPLGSAPAFTQAVSGSRPTLGAIGSEPALVFDGTDDFLRCASAWSAPAAAECFIVATLDGDAPVTNGNGLWRFGTQASGSYEVVPYSDDHSYDGWGSSARKDAGTGYGGPMRSGPCIYSVRTAAGAWSVHLNGTQKYTTATNTVAFQSRPALGGSGNDPASPSTFHKGKMGRFVCYGRVLTAPERALVLGNLATRFGIVIP